MESLNIESMSFYGNFTLNDAEELRQDLVDELLNRWEQRIEFEAAGEPFDPDYNIGEVPF